MSIITIDKYSLDVVSFDSNRKKTKINTSPNAVLTRCSFFITYLLIPGTILPFVSIWLIKGGVYFG